MNSWKLSRLFPNASESFLKANADNIEDIQNSDSLEHTGKIAKLEPDPCHAPLAEKQVQETDTERILISVVSVRERLLDEDNICEKYTIDCLRYAGIIYSDAPEKAHIITTQRKTKKGEEEHTEITITPIS